MSTERTRALGRWGELKAVAVLARAQFSSIRDLNFPTPNHQFADILAEEDGALYAVAVKTRNKFQSAGPLNSTFNMRKVGIDIAAIATRYSATPAWLTIQV